MNYTTNQLIVGSIPLDRNLKRFFLKKYEWLIHHNGVKYADSWFKDLRIAIMHYLEDRSFSDASAKEHLSAYALPTKGLTLKLVRRAEQQPYAVLNFLKFPTGNSLSEGDEEQTYLDLIHELNTTLPSGEAAELRILETFRELQRNAEVYRISKDKRPDFTQVFKKRNWNFLGPITADELANSTPVPADYSDVARDGDVWISYKYLQDIEAWQGNLRSGLTQFNTSLKYGEIHLVKKTGTNDYRAVAAPNRYVQAQMIPLYLFLTELVKGIPTDSTFDQNKFDTLIQSWVDDENISPYGVDIHHATNHLSFRLGKAIIASLIKHHEDDLKSVNVNREYDISTAEVRQTHVFKRTLYDHIVTSMKYFITSSEALWGTPYGDVKFQKGQPLGLLPSFRTLSLTNSLIAEAAVSKVLSETDEVFDRQKWLDLKSNQQYVVLGDDIVFKHKEVGDEYIALMNDMDVPLSLHKSYHSNLVEFAGKIYIKGCSPLYTSDHNPITWNNLFDYQVSTGIKIPYQNLSPYLQRRINRLGEAKSLPAADARVAYDRLISFLTRSNQFGEKTGRWMAAFSYFEAIRKDEAPEHESQFKPDVFLVRTKNGDVKVTNTQLSDYVPLNGLRHTMDIPERARPAWKRGKFKLVTTDIVLDSAFKAYRSIKIGQH